MWGTRDFSCTVGTLNWYIAGQFDPFIKIANVYVSFAPELFSLSALILTKILTCVCKLVTAVLLIIKNVQKQCPVSINRGIQVK